MRLESERLYLRPLCELDAPIMLENTIDEEIRNTLYEWNQFYFFIGAN